MMNNNKKGEEETQNFWGNDPETEQEYYASQNIRSTSSVFRSPSTGLALFTRSWAPPSGPTTSTKALVFMFHGYGNDISWTFQHTPIFLAQHGFACFALDLPGHGRSEGLRAFIPNLALVIDDCIQYINLVKSEHNPSNTIPCFLHGESMGGALCLLIHLRRQLSFRGAVLAAPMCRISDKLRPSWPVTSVLALAARFLPTLAIVPTADLIAKSVKVEEKRAVAAANPMRYNGRPRLGTSLELLRATDDLSRRLTEVEIPFLVMHGSADVVTDPEVSRELYEKARSEDKTIRIYDGMMHSLLFGETDENVDTVRKDILAWLNDKC